MKAPPLTRRIGTENVAHTGAWTMGCEENVSAPAILIHAGAALMLYAIAYERGATSGKKT